MPFSFLATLTLLIISFTGVALSVRFLALRKFTMAYAMVWIGAFLAMALLLTVPPLLDAVTAILHSENQAGALRLLTTATVVGFLMFFSVKVSTLTNRVEELAQRVGLMEYALERQVHQPKPAPKEAESPR